MGLFSKGASQRASDFYASSAMDHAEKARNATTRREQASEERKAKSDQNYADFKADQAKQGR